MIDIDLRTITVTTRGRQVTLTGADIVELLRQELKAQGVKTPHTAIGIGDSYPVVVKWIEKEEG